MTNHFAVAIVNDREDATLSHPHTRVFRANGLDESQGTQITIDLDTFLMKFDDPANDHDVYGAIYACTPDRHRDAVQRAFYAGQLIILAGPQLAGTTYAAPSLEHWAHHLDLGYYEIAVPEANNAA